MLSNCLRLVFSTLDIKASIWSGHPFIQWSISEKGVGHCLWRDQGDRELIAPCLEFEILTVFLEGLSHCTWSKGLQSTLMCPPAIISATVMGDTFCDTNLKIDPHYFLQGNYHLEQLKMKEAVFSALIFLLSSLVVHIYFVVLISIWYHISSTFFNVQNFLTIFIALKLQ